MLKKGDSLFLNNKGMLTVEDVVDRDYNDGNGVKQFYLLKPIFDNTSSMLTLPVEFESNFREPISLKEAKKIINEIGSLDDVWVSDNKERKELFGAMIAKGNPKELASIVKTVFKKKAEYISSKKNLPITDFKIYEFAKKLMVEELAFVLNKSINDVVSMIDEEPSK